MEEVRRKYARVILVGGPFDGRTGLSWRIEVLPDRLWAFICPGNDNAPCIEEPTGAQHQAHIDLTDDEAHGGELYNKVGLDEEDGAVTYQHHLLNLDPIDQIDAQEKAPREPVAA